MVCACSMDKSSIKFWLLFDLKRYIVSCSGCTKSTFGCKMGIDPAGARFPFFQALCYCGVHRGQLIEGPPTFSSLSLSPNLFIIFKIQLVNIWSKLLS